jgi:hypothetical protein
MGSDTHAERWSLRRLPAVFNFFGKPLKLFNFEFTPIVENHKSCEMPEDLMLD